jgi:hypothetical protein
MFAFSGYGDNRDDFQASSGRYRGGNKNIVVTEGQEFPVNTYTQNNQWEPAIANDGNGNFVITWASDGQDGSSYGIFAQRFNSQGKRVGKEFRVNTYTDWWQKWAAVAMDNNGNFVITWQSFGQESKSSFDYGIYAQRFNAKGQRIGKEFRVNIYTKNDQQYPDVAMDTMGNFVITWTSDGQDGSSFGIFARRYNNKGKPVGKEFQVNTYTDYTQVYSAVAMDKNGNFVIVWQSYGPDGSMFGVFARRFNVKGAALGDEFQVNTYTYLHQYIADIGMNEQGYFVIVWESQEQDGSKEGIFAQRYDSNGQPIDYEFQVNTYTEGEQWHPTVIVDEKGNFVIAWSCTGQDGSSFGVYAKMYQQ